MIGWIRNRLRRFGTARGGNVAILVALGSTFLLAAGAVGVDLGLVFQERRKAQAAADIAAMMGAIDPTQANTMARRSLGDNGYGSAVATVDPGTYDASVPGVAPANRFHPGSSPANAVRVGLSTAVPITFGRTIGLAGSIPLRVVGTAASAQFAAFSIGSGTLQVSNGITNALLGAMLGAQLSLSVSDYNALLGTRVDGLRVLDALATSLNLAAANYTDLAQANASVGQVLMALRVAAQGNSGAVNALTGILNALPNAGPTVPIGQVDPLGDAAALAPQRGLAGASVDVMSVLGATAALANGQTQISVDLGATIPGLLSTRLTVAIGERRRSSGWVRPGGPNATIQTAQTRLLIEATASAPLGLGTLTIPIYAEVAPAQATLQALSCIGGARQVTISAQTGLATLAVANVARSAITGGSTGPNLSQPATLIALLLPPVSVTGRAVATIGSTTQTLVFNEADIANHTVKTVSSTGLTQSLTGSLLNSLTLNINPIGLGPLLQTPLSATFAALTPALDLVLDSTLRSLGLHLGYADIDIDGVLCSQAVLVQ
ncbi:pilus assembly protein TadG-related protein [Methylobacterium sp. J-088]|uniref:TadG family pilus assembly protein n=1 Tax=Methylobacterium sp. J-088 TaxID=2836664 RepID=UPI001FBA4913|nr:TadG family pilus assembly protein [Methylobacterium sp. J-088]MCJ2066390.1 pilus assembly protein TadG-related protein [Methylobacterium sp. J-088]